MYDKIGDDLKQGLVQQKRILQSTEKEIALLTSILSGNTAKAQMKINGVIMKRDEAKEKIEEYKALLTQLGIEFEE